MLENNPEEAQELLTKIEKSRAEVGCTKSFCLWEFVWVGVLGGWVFVGGGVNVNVCLSVCLSLSDECKKLAVMLENNKRKFKNC